MVRAYFDALQVTGVMMRKHSALCESPRRQSIEIIPLTRSGNVSGQIAAIPRAKVTPVTAQKLLTKVH